MTVAAIIVAAGRGLRAGEGLPKQFRSVGGGQSSPARSMRFLAHLRSPRASSSSTKTTGALRRMPPSCRLAVPGKAAASGVGRRNAPGFGAKRARGALRGAPPEIVLVHDAARPFASAELDRRRNRGRPKRAARRSPASRSRTRSSSWTRTAASRDAAKARLARRPDAASFRLRGFLMPIIARCGRTCRSFTDDGALAEWAGLPVALFRGDAANIKLTHPADFAAAERRLRAFARSARHAARHRLRRARLRRRAITSGSAACACPHDARRHRPIPTAT